MLTLQYPAPFSITSTQHDDSLGSGSKKKAKFGWVKEVFRVPVNAILYKMLSFRRNIDEMHALACIDHGWPCGRPFSYSIICVIRIPDDEAERSNSFSI